MDVLQRIEGYCVENKDRLLHGYNLTGLRRIISVVRLFYKILMALYITSLNRKYVGNKKYISALNYWLNISQKMVY